MYYLFSSNASLVASNVSFTSWQLDNRRLHPVCGMLGVFRCREDTVRDWSGLCCGGLCHSSAVDCWDVHHGITRHCSSWCWYSQCSIFRDHCSSDHPGSLRLADLLTFDFRTLLWKWWVDRECPPVSIYFLPNHHHDSPVPQRNRRHILRFKGPYQSSRVASDAAVAGMFHCHLHEALTTVGLVNSIGSGPGLCGDSLHPWHQKHGPDAFWAADLTGFLRARHYRLFSL